MKHQQTSPYKKTRKARKGQELKVEKSEDPFIELSEWLNQNRMPNKKQFYSSQQIQEIQDFIELTHGIKLSKKTIEDKVVFRCKRFPQCGYHIQFQMCIPSRLCKKNIHYSLVHCPNQHATRGNDLCFLSQQQLILALRKKYLNLIRPQIKQILLSNQQSPKQNNPTQVLSQLEIKKKLQPDFISCNLQGHYKRQVKKAFDNIVLKTKNQIKFQKPSTLPAKLKIPKTKKIHKQHKKQPQILQKLDQLDIQDVFPSQNCVKLQIPQILMIEEHEIQQKSLNVYEKCFNEVKIEEELFNDKILKTKQDSNIFQTPTKKKEKFGFDLQNSGQKHRTTYNKSYQQVYLFESDEKSQHMKSGSQSEYND